MACRVREDSRAAWTGQEVVLGEADRIQNRKRRVAGREEPWKGCGEDGEPLAWSEETRTVGALV